MSFWEFIYFKVAPLKELLWDYSFVIIVLALDSSSTLLADADLCTVLIFYSYYTYLLWSSSLTFIFITEWYYTSDLTSLYFWKSFWTEFID